MAIALWSLAYLAVGGIFAGVVISAVEMDPKDVRFSMISSTLIWPIALPMTIVAFGVSVGTQLGSRIISKYGARW